MYTFTQVQNVNTLAASDGVLLTALLSSCHFSQGLATSWFRPPPAWWWGRWSKVEQDCLNSNNPCSSVRDTKRHVTLCYIVADLASAAARNGFGETHRAEAAVPEHRTAERGSPKPSHPSGL